MVQIHQNIREKVVHHTVHVVGMDKGSNDAIVLVLLLLDCHIAGNYEHLRYHTNQPSSHPTLHCDHYSTISMVELLSVERYSFLCMHVQLEIIGGGKVKNKT